MSQVRKLELKTHVLTELRRVSPQLLSESGLLNLLRILVTPVPLKSEVAERLAEMEAGRLVIAVRDSIETDVVRWGITDIGRAKLAELEAR